MNGKGGKCILTKEALWQKDIDSAQSTRRNLVAWINQKKVSNTMSNLGGRRDGLCAADWIELGMFVFHRHYYRTLLFTMIMHVPHDFINRFRIRRDGNGSEDRRIGEYRRA